MSRGRRLGLKSDEHVYIELLKFLYDSSNERLTELRRTGREHGEEANYHGSILACFRDKYASFEKQPKKL